MVLHPEEAARKCSVDQMFLKNHKNHGKAPLLESLFNKVVGPEACNFIKKRLQYNFFYCESCIILKDMLFYKTALVAATNCSGLYNFVSNSNDTSLSKRISPTLYEFS